MALPIRAYRIYLRDGENVLARAHDVELASDEEARGLAMLMLGGQTTHPCAEVWDRARLVCTVLKGDQAATASQSQDTPPG
jgi:hypothetical protein